MSTITQLSVFGIPGSARVFAAPAADVVQYATPLTIILGSSPAVLPSVLTGTGDVEETGGGADSLADFNATLNASTGAWTFGVGGATPAGSYSLEFARNGGTPQTVVVHVVADTGTGAAAIPKSTIERYFVEEAALRRSFFGR